ncbi:MAG TPA: NfeD family protein [Symbiobacteriaceae bacterium]|jgi:membrane-bound serine protease (ClpP class)
MRRTLALLLLAFMTVLAFLPGTALAEGKRTVYVLHIDGQQEIDPSLAQVTQRVFEQAQADPNCVAVAMVIDTPGGLVSSALEMKDTILSFHKKSVAFVSGTAWSAGALIATAGEKLYMRADTSIGAAEPRYSNTNQTADYKTVSAVVAAFKAAAEARGRDPNLAAAMVDKNVKVPGQPSELLVMTAKEAVDKHYADGVAADLADALRQAGISDYELNDVQPTLSESAGRFLTTPWVAILLLVVGVVAIGIEFLKPGVTLPGLIGVTSLGLFFLGNVLMGTASWPELALALLGVLLLVIEAFIPGFGVFGVGGLLCMGGSIFLSVRTPQLAVLYLMWTSIAFVLAIFALVRGISQRGLGKALTLQHDETGYVPARADLTGLIGQEGKALTVLRPAGSAMVGSEKVDVVTEGEYLPAGTPVRVLRVDGARVVVRAIV